MIGSFTSIIVEQVNWLKKSGIWDAAGHIYVGLAGPEENLALTKLLLGSKVEVIARDVSSRQYERLTLHAMHSKAMEDSFYALYLHSKGVTRPVSVFPQVPPWRNMMMYFLCMYAPKALSLLEEGSTGAVGVCYFPGPPHFSGNFWWASSAAIRSLPVPIGVEYLDPEMWIGKNSVGMQSLYHFPEWRCIFTPFRKHSYINQFLPEFFHDSRDIPYYHFPLTSYFGRDRHVTKIKLHPVHFQTLTTTWRKDNSERNITLVVGNDMFKTLLQEGGGEEYKDPCEQTRKVWVFTTLSQKLVTFLEGEKIRILL